MSFNQVCLEQSIANAKKILAPVWPLQTAIACNPLQGFESLPFKEAITKGISYFQQKKTSKQLEALNRELIKWCLAFCDRSQATISMPERHLGFYKAWRLLAIFDSHLHQKNKDKRKWLKELPTNPFDSIAKCLNYLAIPEYSWETFFKFNLAQLPGWGGYILYCEHWQNAATQEECFPISILDFIAVRLAITCMLYPNINQSLKIEITDVAATENIIKTIESNEIRYRTKLINAIASQVSVVKSSTSNPIAQVVFCIDVRSEPMRRQLEAQGPYETLGFAGFFGLPVSLYDYNQNKIIDSCPVLLKPKHEVHEKPFAGQTTELKKQKILNRFLKLMKSCYQALKYNFATTFTLVEVLGLWCGILMLLRTFCPCFTNSLKSKLLPQVHMQPDLSRLGREKINYAEAVLRTIGLTNNFAQLVVFCGHGSTTTNNAYASALDCGACGGNHGGANARILASILNQLETRSELEKRGFKIPPDTVFLAAEHNTTTDAITIYENETSQRIDPELFVQFKTALVKAQYANCVARIKNLNFSGNNFSKAVLKRSNNWAEVRPEWGLAKNAAFIVGPRLLTKSLNLEGRCFLHSYDWQQDTTGTALETILTAPMVVAHWINTQYLFSTIDNIAYGSGSKITQNIAGKIGVMQGNASDLMHGLPLQSVNSEDGINYHEPLRLLTIVYAPPQIITPIIKNNATLKKLFSNEWLILIAINPHNNTICQLNSHCEWQNFYNKEFFNISITPSYAQKNTIDV